MIRIENLYKVYKMGTNEVNALSDISISIKAKEFVAIIGPSGSGKSTLMNMIGCLDVPTTGKYYVDDILVSSMRDDQLANIRNKKIGFIFQNFNLLGKLTALENVELPLVYMGLSRKERLTLSYEALERVGLSERMNHRPNELSGGQQQRVAIARALSSRPAIILADEPTGALDSKTGVEVLAMLHDLHKEGKTIVLITHDNKIAAQANRIINIEDGRITSDMENEVRGA